MNTQYTFEAAQQRSAQFIADADNARLVKSLRRSAKHGRTAAGQSAGTPSTARTARTA